MYLIPQQNFLLFPALFFVKNQTIYFKKMERGKHF